MSLSRLSSLLLMSIKAKSGGCTPATSCTAVLAAQVAGYRGMVSPASKTARVIKITSLLVEKCLKSHIHRIIDAQF